MTPHEVLGVSPDATVEEAEAAYYRLLRIHHPDLHQDAGPEAIAAAEARTRALNLAMARVRDLSGSGPVGAATRTGTDGQETAAAGATERTAQAEREPAGADAAPPWDEPDPVVSAPCPFCGEAFAAARDLKQHVAAAHGVRLDVRARRRRRPSRIGNALRRWQYVSIWYLLPLNLLAALILGTAVAPVDPLFAFWVFGIAMAPTIILAVTRGAGPRG